MSRKLAAIPDMSSASFKEKEYQIKIDTLSELLSQNETELSRVSTEYQVILSFFS